MRRWSAWSFAPPVVVGSLLLAQVACGQIPVEGFTEPVRRAELAPAEPGTVSAIHCQEGQRVRQGEVLAALESEVLQFARKQAQANLASTGKLAAARAECDLRQSRCERLQALQDRGHANREEVARAQADLDVANANLRIAEEQRILDELECQRTEALIERRMIRSPFDGIVLRVHREIGEYVSTTAPTVLTIVQLDRLRVLFSVATEDAHALKAGQAIVVEFPDTGRKLPAQIESVSPMTDPESGTVRVRVLIDNAQGLLRGGVKCVFVPPSVQLPSPSKR